MLCLFNVAVASGKTPPQGGSVAQGEDSINGAAQLQGANKTNLNQQLESLSLQTNKEDAYIWDRYVRKFRRDHHIAVSSGFDRGMWHVGSFGRLQETSHNSEGVDTTIQYSFHLQIIAKFGYYLGTSSGYYAELRRRHDDDFGPSSMWKLPGIAAGLVHNYDPTGRFYAGTEVYLSRIVRLESVNTSGESETIAVTGESFDIMYGWDKFVSLNWAIRIQAHDRRMWVPAPMESEGYPVDARLRRVSKGLTLGALYHFL
ncbi:MAG: hypothetical protein NTV34_12630 [Proteobacteria bacterium]|nr:hypothetical protein [Pseudomonadota bacterium]